MLSIPSNTSDSRLLGMPRNAELDVEKASTDDTSKEVHGWDPTVENRIPMFTTKFPCQILRAR